MIVLQTTTQKLEAVLAGAVTTNQLDVTTTFFDQIPQATTTERRRGHKVTNTNGTTDVEIVAAPALNGIIRNVETLHINNRDTATATVTIKIDDGGTETIQVKQAIAAGESLVYEHTTGWQILSPITPPFVDSTEIVKGSADATKKVRFEVDGLTAGATRVLTVLDADFTLGTATQVQQETGTATTVSVTPGRQHFHPSALKVWASIDMPGTPAVFFSYNVTSLTDTDVGRVTLNLTAAFSAVNYPTVSSMSSNLGSSFSRVNATGTIIVGCFSTDGANTSADIDVNVVAAGDL